LYRARSPEDLVFRSELEVLARQRGLVLHLLVGQRGSRAMPDDPLSARALITRVPDIAGRDVYVCGPVAMMERVERALGELGVPRDRIHTERFTT
jgi:ferredoxin-NADP reductase